MSLRTLLFSNFRRKIFALLLAVIVWSTVTVIMQRTPADEPPARPNPGRFSPPHPTR